MSVKKRRGFSFRSGSSKSSSITSMNEGLKMCYRKVLKPLEDFYSYENFYTSFMEESDFDAKPMVLLVGQYSTGKTTFIRYLLGEDFPGIRIGPEPTTDNFIIIMRDQHKRIIPGNALVMDPSMPFRTLVTFGNAFLNRLQCSMSDSPVLNGMTLVDTPGILSGQKQNTDRGYDFTQVLEWFGNRVDRILILFDAHKLDISDELRRAIVALKCHEDKIRIVLNKSDLIDSQELMRVYGALMWSLGKVLDTPEVVRIYIGSFWDQTFKKTESRNLFEKEEEDLFKDLRNLPRQSAIRKLNDFIKRARAVKVHVIIISELTKNMPNVFGKEKKRKELIDNLETIYKNVQDRYNLLPCDLPPIEKMRERLKVCDWSAFRSADRKLMDRLDRMLTEDLPRIMKSYNPEMNSDLNGPIDDIFDTNTPFQTEFRSMEEEALWSSSNMNDDDSLWYVAKQSTDMYLKWKEKFEALGPINGKLTGAIVRTELLENTKLNKATLSKIWTLSDIDKDGLLDEDEFCLAMYLVEQKINGKNLPHVLPNFLFPPSKK